MFQQLACRLSTQSTRTALEKCQAAKESPSQVADRCTQEVHVPKNQSRDHVIEELQYNYTAALEMPLHFYVLCCSGTAGIFSGPMTVDLANI